MWNITIISTAAITLNFISLIGAIFMGLICTVIISALLPSIIRHHDVVLILVANNYLSLLAFAIVAISSNVDMVRGDYNLYIGMETFSCRIKGYTVYAFMAVIFNTFALQAIFRFFRVVCPSYVWLQHARTYTVIIPMLWLISFLFMLPIHFWHDIQFIRMENICLVAIHSIRGFLWSNMIIYGIPIIVINIIYIQLVRFIHRPSMVASVRAKRDVIVARRIALVVCILTLMVIPSVVLKLMLPFTDVGKPLFYRIQNLVLVTGMIVLSLMLVYVTPQVKEILMRIGKLNTITPIHT
ncbi:unnamed protein product [Rotaria sp. Silwood1]|nr:unnamed protein product [Rotaria sp. Silwood1]CAF3486474.1 unnamed protein product [Rotaria sp. Silwood1]CAF3552504.1 unnamed protein product [Rotaria sp. Silwood1]CAF3556020.1 unnamed protein product [Rotaria sp. Silwood1]CAF4757270.1 unnamed protein product [Rotaria sp. Silwood1]